MITCMACTKREGKFTAEGADPFRVRSHYLLNLCQGKPGSVLFDPACTFKGGHALAGYSMETALDIMRGNRATTDGIAGNAGARERLYPACAGQTVFFTSRFPGSHDSFYCTDEIL